jgi:hypothetical protein
MGRRWGIDMLHWLPRYGERRRPLNAGSDPGSSRDFVWLVVTAVVVIAIIWLPALYFPNATPWWTRGLIGVGGGAAITWGQRRAALRSGRGER